MYQFSLLWMLCNTCTITKFILIFWAIYPAAVTIRPQWRKPRFSFNFFLNCGQIRQEDFISYFTKNPVRIRVRINPPHPLVCRKRRLNGLVLWMRPGKPTSRVTAGVARKRSLLAQRTYAPSIGLNFAALNRQWWRLHRSEKFLSGT
jgi:hypothetical protein